MPVTVDELKTMSIADILAKYPQTEPILKQFGLLAYAATETAKLENLEASALVQGVDLAALISQLNAKVNG